MTDKWIPVSERLPSDTEWVLTHSSRGWIYYQQYIQYGPGGISWWVGEQGFDVEEGPITHWMPKPLPPEDLED